LAASVDEGEARKTTAVEVERREQTRTVRIRVVDKRTRDGGGKKKKKKRKKKNLVKVSVVRVSQV
jgi:hypothetical protein